MTTSGCDTWIWIASLSLVAATTVLSIILIALYYGSGRFRAVVGGFKADRLTVVLKRVSTEVLFENRTKPDHHLSLSLSPLYTD